MNSLKKSIIFDVDGTLIDSVDVHAQAWQEAMAKFGIEIDIARIRDQIGKGGNELMQEFLSRSDLHKFGDDLKDYRSRSPKKLKTCF
jgi:beta-phosphoglucomutase-like phosphatase (HAD superfamily)